MNSTPDSSTVGDVQPQTTLVASNQPLTTYMDHSKRNRTIIIALIVVVVVVLIIAVVIILVSKKKTASTSNASQTSTNTSLTSSLKYEFYYTSSNVKMQMVYNDSSTGIGGNAFYYEPSTNNPTPAIFSLIPVSGNNTGVPIYNMYVNGLLVYAISESYGTNPTITTDILKLDYQGTVTTASNPNAQFIVGNPGVGNSISVQHTVNGSNLALSSCSSCAPSYTDPTTGYNSIYVANFEPVNAGFQLYCTPIS